MNIQLNDTLKIAIIYGAVWFIDLLDASILNVALPSIAEVFGVAATQAEWAIIGFLFALTVAIPVSSWLGDTFGAKKLFLWSQGLYTISSLACGLAPSLGALVAFRITQGAAGGLLIPVGMTLLMRTVSQKQWASVASNMNMVSLLAPALGPILAGYVTINLGWRWLFFIKLPLSIACLLLTFLWLKKEQTAPTGPFDWIGFILSGASLATLFIVVSEIGKNTLSIYSMLFLFAFSVITAIAFVISQLKSAHPMIPLSIFRFKTFSIGNIIQCAANILFLGSTFITGLFLQNGLQYDIVKTGWVLAAVTPGMMVVLPLVSRYYNRLGPIPFIVPGLLLMSASMFMFLFFTPTVSPIFVAAAIFLLGAGSAVVQTPNVMVIFCEIPSDLKGVGSSIYSLGKQLSASIGVALSIMILTLAMSWYQIAEFTSFGSSSDIKLFQIVFAILGLIPLLALPLCLLMDNKRALSFLKKAPNVESEIELGAE